MCILCGYMFKCSVPEAGMHRPCALVQLVGGPAGTMEGGRQAEVAKAILTAKNVPYVVAAPLLIQVHCKESRFPVVFGRRAAFKVCECCLVSWPCQKDKAAVRIDEALRVIIIHRCRAEHRRPSVHTRG